jgi:hypothetical protein
MLGGGELRRRVIWDKPGKPEKWVSHQLGIEPWRLRDAIHDIKASNDLGGSDRVVIYSDGEVEDEDGRYLGNIRD